MATTKGRSILVRMQHCPQYTIAFCDIHCECGQLIARLTSVRFKYTRPKPRPHAVFCESGDERHTDRISSAQTWCVQLRCVLSNCTVYCPIALCRKFLLSNCNAYCPIAMYRAPVSLVHFSAGLALVFRQPPTARLLHDGQRVEEGVKYLLRTDIMYRQEAK